MVGVFRKDEIQVWKTYPFEISMYLGLRLTAADTVIWELLTILLRCKYARPSDICTDCVGG